MGAEGSHYSKNFFFRPEMATATNWIHSNDLEAYVMKCCCFWFHSVVKFFTLESSLWQKCSLYSGERSVPLGALVAPSPSSPHVGKERSEHLVMPPLVSPLLLRKLAARQDMDHYSLFITGDGLAFQEGPTSTSSKEIATRLRIPLGIRSVRTPFSKARPS